MRRPVVAIDGPAGAGKSTVTKRVADELGYLLVDTGALYRTVALAAQRARVSWDDDEALGELAYQLVNQRAVVLGNQKSSGFTVKLRDEDVSLAIREPSVSQGASKVSAVPAVRDALLDMQRQAGASGGVVLEGRDIGTVVFPTADVKLYLDASAEERARRRALDPAHSGPAAIADVATLLSERDRSDSTRAASPLYAAADATVIDTTGAPIDEVVARVMGIVRGRLSE